MKLFVVVAFALVGYATAELLKPMGTPAEVADIVAAQQIRVHPKDRTIDSLPEGRITNGWRANDGQIPYQAGLGFSSSQGGWWCGGSLIGSNWILTAAHCTSGAHSVTVYLGATGFTQARWSTTVGSGNFRQHPHYNTQNLNHDISLINIPSVGYSSFIRNVALPPFAWEHEPFAGHWTTASGWGLTHDGGQIANELQFTYLQIIDNNACRSRWGYISDETLCTNTVDGVSTCSGDSGGPLVLYGYDLLVGVTSFVSGNGCQSGMPAGFVRVSKYLDWIRGHTGITG